jgi:hypothetical protein
MWTLRALLEAPRLLALLAIGRRVLAPTAYAQAVLDSADVRYFLDAASLARLSDFESRCVAHPRDSCLATLRGRAARAPERPVSVTRDKR